MDQAMKRMVISGTAAEDELDIKGGTEERMHRRHGGESGRRARRMAEGGKGERAWPKRTGRDEGVKRRAPVPPARVLDIGSLPRKQPNISADRKKARRRRSRSRFQGPGRNKQGMLWSPAGRGQTICRMKDVKMNEEAARQCFGKGEGEKSEAENG